MKLSFIPQTIYFKRPFSIAHGTRNSTPVVFTKIEHDEFIGYGEASMPPYLGENHETVLKFLEKASRILGMERFSELREVETILQAIDEIENANNAAKASVDIALHDLLGKILNKPCHRIFAEDNPSLPLGQGSNLFTLYTIPIDEPEGIRKRIEEARDYKILKVKLGSDDDKKIIQSIRNFSDKPISVDVNEGWTDKHFALDMIHWLNERNVLFVEQPMPKEKIDDAAWLTEKSPLPILADESVKRLTDLEKAKAVYSGINIKLMKCTGLNEARKMISLAKKFGMKILIGCMSETSCGVSAAAQLTPLADWADLDGPLLIKEDFFEGIKFQDGKIILNDLPGIGVKPHPSLPSPVGEGKGER